MKIRDVVERTGVPANTIYTWEKRGRLGRPSRTETNRRLYSEDDVAAIISWRDREKRRGFHVVTRADSANERGTVSPERPAPRLDRPAPADLPDHGPLSKAYERFDFGEADRAFDSLLAASDLGTVVDIAIGEQKILPAGPVRRFAGEHLRSRILRFLPMYLPDVDRRPVAIGAVGLADDLPALAAGLLLARRGYPIAPLGRQLSIETLRRFEERSPASGVIVAARSAADLDEWPEQPLGRTTLCVIGVEAWPDRIGYVTLPESAMSAVLEFEKHLR